MQTYQPERTAEALTGTDEDLVVRIYGHELDVLYDKAEEVRQNLAGINGVAEVRADYQAEEPQIEIEVDLAAAERYQIKPGDVRRQATTLLSGLRVGNLYEENKVFDVVVWGTPEIRHSLTDIQNLLINTPVITSYSIHYTKLYEATACLPAGSALITARKSWARRLSPCPAATPSYNFV